MVINDIDEPRCDVRFESFAALLIWRPMSAQRMSTDMHYAVSRTVVEPFAVRPAHLTSPRLRGEVGLHRKMQSG